jgi:iron complex transport system substrate-binding protein
MQVSSKHVVDALASPFVIGNRIIKVTVLSFFYRLVLFFVSFCSYFMLTSLDFPLVYAAENLGINSVLPKVASMHICSDELLLSIASSEQILSLSYLSHIPDYFLFSDEATQYPINRGQAEEIIKLQPDLVFAGPFSTSFTVRLLRQQEQNVFVLSLPNSLRNAEKQILKVGELLKRKAEASALVSQLVSKQLEAKELVKTTLSGTSALFISNNGYSYGQGTLHDDFLVSLGFKNALTTSGLKQLSVEELLVLNPDFLIVDVELTKMSPLAIPILQHPALRGIININTNVSGISPSLLVLPEKLIQCGGPSLIDAYQLLVEQLRVVTF